MTLQKWATRGYCTELANTGTARGCREDRDARRRLADILA